LSLRPGYRGHVSMAAVSAFDLAALSRRLPEIARFIEEMSEIELRFRGPEPLDHSRDNHVHLWAIEHAADSHREIDLAFRCAAIRHIFARWTARLKAYAPYTAQGYRLYVYGDMAPTLSVVAETPRGCPYGEVKQVDDIETVVRPYVGQSWAARFEPVAGLGPERLLAAIDREHGSLGATARHLGWSVAALRRDVERWEIGPDVNRLRKRHGRRPARFADPLYRVPDTLFWEQRLPPRY
jgi:hypothetical protein